MATKQELEQEVADMHETLDKIFEIADEAGPTKAEMEAALQEIVELSGDGSEEEDEDEDDEADDGADDDTEDEEA